jgi:hypothetical protein
MRERTEEDLGFVEGAGMMITTQNSQTETEGTHVDGATT